MNRRWRWIAGLVCALVLTCQSLAWGQQGNATTIGIEPVPASWPSGDTGSCGNGNPSTSVWAQADYLLWWVRPFKAPPLLTTGDPTVAVPGALDSPGTRILYGGSGDSYGTFNGGRLTLGGWLDSENTWGVEGSGFLLEQRSAGIAAGGDAAGNPPLYVPVFRSGVGREGSFTISDPIDRLTGAVAITPDIRLWGAEINGLANVYRNGAFAMDVLAGYRYLDLHERLGIAYDLYDPVFDVRQQGIDQFSARNQFHGGQLGVRLGYEGCRFTADLTARTALGCNHEVVGITGQSQVGGPGAVNPGTFPGAVFTQPTNIGQQSTNQFAVLTQLQFRTGYKVTDWCRFIVGYDFLHLNQAVRAGPQVDHSLNTSQQGGGVLVGPATPAPQFNRTDFWAHGVQFGLDLRF